MRSQSLFRVSFTACVLAGVMSVYGVDAPAAPATQAVSTTESIPTKSITTGAGLATGPTTAPTTQTAAGAATQPVAPATVAAFELGPIYRNRVEGIEVSPVAGGQTLREHDASEIVRFVYPDHGWDVRIKPVDLPPSAETLSNEDLTELTKKQLIDSSPAAQAISTQMIGRDKSIGLIEARDSIGSNRIFIQQAIFRPVKKRYFLVQMTCPTRVPRKASENVVDADENMARAAFTKMLSTVHLIDPAEFYDEQRQRLGNTKALWLNFDRKHVEAAIVPQHFSRILRDGKDVGFIQYDERVVMHGVNQGVEVIVRSRFQEPEAVDVKHTDAGNITTNMAAPSQQITIARPTPGPATMPVDAPRVIYTSSTFFFSFDHDLPFVCSHEDWETITQIDKLVKGQTAERGNCDLHWRYRLNRDPNALGSARGPAAKDKEPNVQRVEECVLQVSQDVRNRHATPISTQVGPSYLPQGMSLMLSRLIPLEPRQFMFASYISSAQNLMWRYVDVDAPETVTLDDKTFRAYPIRDRLGADSNPITMYVDKSGRWVGTTNSAGEVVQLPATAADLANIWGAKFGVAPLPPEPTDIPDSDFTEKKKPNPLGDPLDDLPDHGGRSTDRSFNLPARSPDHAGRELDDSSLPVQPSHGDRR